MYRNSSSNYNSSSSAKDSSRYNSASQYNFRDAEEEQNDVKQIVDQTKSIRNESLMATRDAVSRLRRTEDSAGKTLSMLDGQSEKLHRAKTDLDVTKAEHKVAEEKIKELDRLSKWLPFSNPFKSSKSEKKLAHAKNKSNLQERLRNDDETRASRHASQRRQEDIKRATSRVEGRTGGATSSHIDSDLLDDDDRKAEAEIDANLDEISNVTSRLKIMAQGMSDEVDSQNKLIDKLGKNADEMNVRVGMASSRVQKY